MGGEGSTRWGKHRKAIPVEACFCISIHALKLKGVLSEPSEVWQTVLPDREEGVITSINPLSVEAVDLSGTKPRLLIQLGKVRQEVSLRAWAPRLGGRSWFMRCPICTHRSHKLFRRPDCSSTERSPFRCWRCWRLSRVSSQDSHYWEQADRKLFVWATAYEMGLSMEEVVRGLRTNK